MLYSFMLVIISQKTEKQCKSKNYWHGMMAQQLRALVSVAEVPRSALNTYITAHGQHTFCSEGRNFWSMQVLGSHVIHKHAGKSCTIKRKKLLAWFIFQPCRFYPVDEFLYVYVSMDTQNHQWLSTSFYYILCFSVSIF